MAFCENCGAPVPDDAKFCEACGAKINPIGGAYKTEPEQSARTYRQEPAPAPVRPVQSRPVQEQYRPNNSTERKPEGGKSKAGLIVAIIAAVAIIAVVALILIGKGRKGGGNDPEGSGSNVESTQKAGGNKTGGSSQIKLPDGAEIKKDAQFVEFIGKYEGEIQITTLDGFEKMDGVPKDWPEQKKKILGSPSKCDFEIEEDGGWDLDIDIMAGMDFDSNDYDNPEEMTPAEINDLLITMPSGGQFHVKMAKDEVVDGQRMTMRMDNIGAYCEKGDEKLIAGNFYTKANLYGNEVTIQGDYVVYKTSGEFYVEETAPKETEKVTEEETEAETETEAQTETEAETTASGDVSQGMREIGTVTGGTWTQMGSGAWVYEKDGRMVKDSWVDDGGVFYYVDEDGYMLTDGITPDGYYVGPDGAYVQNGSQGSSSGGGNASGGSSADLSEIAAKLSTDEIAYATEFEWFLDMVLNDGTGAGVVVTDPTRASVFTDYKGLSGGWKAYSRSAGGDDTERYFNADISSDGDDFNITMNWKYLWIASSGESVDESASDLFKGKFDKNSGSATARSDYAKVDFDHFYVSADGKAQYAIGKFYWISGEVDDIALMRFAK